jgi:hypothetical protein
MLPLKTITEVQKGHALKFKTKSKLTPAPAKKKARTSFIDDENTAGQNGSISPANSFQNSNPKVSSFQGVQVCFNY